jgi:alpha-tubulin suppressor-like RCC1 family protein
VVFPGCDETPCSTTASINVPIIDDTLSENNETVVLNLGAPTTGVGAGANLAHTLTINDEDLVINFSTSAVTAAEGASGILTLQLSSPHSIPVGETLDVPLTISGTATSGSDFTAFSTTVSFNSVSTTQNVTVPVIDDNLNEKAETVIVTIGTPVYSGATYEGVIGTTSVGTVTISESDPVTAISLGAGHTCVTINVTGNDTIKCWGDNSSMQIANATTTNNIGDQINEMGSNLTALSPTTNFYQVASGKNHSCALDGTTVKCWGDDSFGQVGDGAASGPYSTPQAVSGLGGAVSQIVVGDNHSCALLTGGTVQCWGDNTFGQLGMNAPTANATVATAVSGLSGIIAISAGGDHTCAIQGTPRYVYCWGDNDYGQLGQDNTNNLGDVAGEMTTLSTDPISFISGFTPNRLALGKDHSCALSTSGAAICWGKNLYGQLGVDNVNAYGSSATYPMSSLVGINTGAASFSKISAGGDSTCLITSGNLLQCFGSNTYGQLGIESIASVGQNTGDMIAIHTTDLGSSLYATSVSLGDSHTCAILNNGQVKCFGLNTFGQLGLENTTIKGDNSGEMGSNLNSPSF